MVSDRRRDQRSMSSSDTPPSVAQSGQWMRGSRSCSFWFTSAISSASRDWSLYMAQRSSIVNSSERQLAFS